MQKLAFSCIYVLLGAGMCAVEVTSVTDCWCVVKMSGFM
jgi:hypothetical protein